MKQVVKQEAKVLTIPTDTGDFFDEAVVTDTKDIVIPRVLLMQGTSDLVGKQKALQGDIIDSVSSEVLGKPGKGVEVIPIKQLDKVWSIEKWNGRKFEYERTDPWDETVRDQLEFMEGSDKLRRNARLSFYVLLARDCKSNHLPYMVSFQRTGYSAGKNIASFFSEALFAFKNGDRNSIPMAQVFELGCRMDSGDLGPYYVFECKRARVSTPEELEKAKYWFGFLKTKSYKVDEDKPAVEVKQDF